MISKEFIRVDIGVDIVIFNDIVKFDLMQL